MMERAPIVVTGAAGFVGQACVAAARKAGHPVRAIVRRSHDLPAAWDAGVSTHIADLALDPALGEILDGACAVIHAAAGSTTSHSTDTLKATSHLLKEISSRELRLVLVSSMSVYGYAALPDYTTLDETTPADPDMDRRDNYAQAKHAQDMLAIAAAQNNGLDLWIIRPGAIYGAGRLWSARLGYPKAGRVLVPGGNVPVPAIHVDSCAEGLIAAATRACPDRSDVPIISGGGTVTTVNLTDPDPPSQRMWLQAIGKTSVISLPVAPILKIARGLDLLADLWPAFNRILPVGVREATLAARFKPLKYTRARAEDLLAHHPTTCFADALKTQKQENS